MSSEIPLGKETQYPSQYDASLLFPVLRQLKRDELGFGAELPFVGSDIWNGYELSWLNTKGKPQVAIGVFEFAYDSPNIIESKSFKLYLNSFNQSRFEFWQQVSELMTKDLSIAAGKQVVVQLYSLDEFNQQFPIVAVDGESIDELDIKVDNFDYQPELLQLESDVEINEVCHEILTSDLLKSNCLITNQPDWASIIIEYQGRKINREALLKYLISFRTHNEFHEQCVERIFTDLMQKCQPQELTVYARYTRRGGLDINPFRTNVTDKQAQNIRLSRQ
ncbi:MAG: NADPH-dependent 7-cyano-7-deazaguanine reductase QueF [Kangiellaceae bacterium]|nr:NADPH-dependent 7-cyano-7-deazaguanine reductase QueF [Kangiellaceae bacterium]